MIDYDRSRPIIFLDIDGVLNRCGCHDGTGHHFVPECVWALDWVLEKTNAVIVLSSAWRYMTFDTDEHKAAMTLPGFEYLLRTHGLRAPLSPIIVDTTASDEAVDRREDQIERWWLDHGHDRYVVIDDAPLGIRPGKFVNTVGRVGLTIDNAISAARILGANI